MNVDNERKRKTVQIKLKEHGDSSGKSLTFDVSIPDDEGATKSDLEYVVEAVKKKKPKMADVLEKSELMFQVESEIFKGDYVDIGDSSPVKHLSKLLCLYERPKISKELVSDSQNIQHHNDDDSASSVSSKELLETKEQSPSKGTLRSDFVYPFHFLIS